MHFFYINILILYAFYMFRQWRTEGGVWGVQPPYPPEILKALQNRAKLNLFVKTVKNCWILGRQHTKMFRKKAVKF